MPLKNETGLANLEQTSPFNQDTLAAFMQDMKADSSVTNDTYETNNGNTLPIEKQALRTTSVSSNLNPGSSTADQRAVFLRFENSVTIESGVTVQPSARKLGLFIFVEGDIDINGTISMDSLAANHSSSGSSISPFDITLVDEIGTDGTIPATGGSGGAGQYSSGSYVLDSGKPGGSGVDGGTGGGGSGTAYNRADSTADSGAGADGTAFAGGSGGGAAIADGGSATAQDAQANGGYGGDAACDSGDEDIAGAGGAGNPGGANACHSGTAGDGNGGLIVIFATGNITVDGKITSAGSDHGSISASYEATGGASGGGSINLYHAGSFTNNGTVTAPGGNAGGDGEGGAGTTRNIQV